jgi:chromosome segregation ATPase
LRAHGVPFLELERTVVHAGRQAESVFGERELASILKENAVKLEAAVSEQKQVIENQKKDFAEILEANKKINELINNLKKDLDDLDKRFTKKDRDIGKLAIDRTKSVERVINKGADNATRCIEIASGSPLTEEEKNATKKSEINPECPSIANPKYIPY